MQNVTITMDEALVRLTEAEATKAGKSLSDFISEIVARNVAPEPAYTPQREALERVFAGPLIPLSENGRMPSADERNARR